LLGTRVCVGPPPSPQPAGTRCVIEHVFLVLRVAELIGALRGIVLCILLIACSSLPNTRLRSSVSCRTRWVSRSLPLLRSFLPGLGTKCGPPGTDTPPRIPSQNNVPAWKLARASRRHLARGSPDSDTIKVHRAWRFYASDDWNVSSLYAISIETTPTAIDGGEGGVVGLG